MRAYAPAVRYRRLPADRPRSAGRGRSLL